MAKEAPVAVEAEAPPAWLAQLVAAMPKGLDADALKELLKANSSDSATAMKRSLRPENETSAPNSVYHPLGMDKPSLIRETFVCYVKQREDNLTPGEIEALNKIDRNMDAENGRWTARIEANGNGERLFINFPCKSIDDRMSLPNPGRHSTKTGLEMICETFLQG